MSEAIWIELIKIIPTFVWLGLGIGALLVAKRLLAQQAHRMTRVESPFVSVDFAQDAIEQAFNRGPETPTAPFQRTAQVPGTRAPIEGPSLPGEAPSRQEPAPERVPVDWGAPGGTPQAGSAEPGWNRPRTPADDTDRTHVLRPRRPTDSDPSDEEDVDLSSLLDEDDPETDDEGVQTAPANRDPQSAETPPNIPVAPYPVPAYASVPAPPGFQPLYPPPGPRAAGTSHYRPPSYYAITADPNRSLRAATRLAGAADLLQGGAVLWVDDHHQWNEPLIRLFRTAGMKVDPVGSTEEALRYLDRDPYDLVITDLRRERDPGDGVAGMALLDRLVARGIPTPAVVFSDNPQVRTMSHPRAAATTNSPEELVDRVVDLVAHRRNALNQQAQAAHLGGYRFGG
jgi:hypothetical protein